MQIIGSYSICRATGTAKNYDMASFCHGLQRAGKSSFAHTVNDYWTSLAACYALDFLDKILLVVVDRMIAAGSLGQLCLGRAGGGADHLRPFMFEPLAEEQSHTTGGGMNQDVLARLHLPELLRSLEHSGIAHAAIIVPPGETSKSLATWSEVVDQLLTQKVDRHTTIVALGGGVVGDLAGYAAAATLRGLPFVQIPTTLLAQVDSSVGGKTGINAKQGKNLIGAFHQPQLVLADIDVLKTLPPRELRAGYAEIVKAGLIADAAFYEWCETHAAAMLAGDAALLAEAVERAVAFKAAVVGDDEREEKPNDGRALLNLGHTFAHALEAETGYTGALLHGEAVATGLVLATELSAKLGLCPQEDPGRIAAHLAAIDLPTRIAGLPADHLLAHMKQDKKMRGGKLTFVLTRGIGQAFTSRDVPEDAVREVLLANGAV